MLMNIPHLQMAGIEALANLAFPHMNWVLMCKWHPNQLHSIYWLCRLCLDPMKCSPMCSNWPYYCPRWSYSEAMLTIVLLAVDFDFVNVKIAVDDWRALDEFVLLPLSLYCSYCCCCWYCCCYYYLQFVPECPTHMLGIDRESTAITLDLHRALCTTDTVILPPSHKHSTLLRVHCITNNCSLNSLSLIYSRSVSTVDGRRAPATGCFYTEPKLNFKRFCCSFDEEKKLFRSCANIYRGIFNGTYVIWLYIAVNFLLFTIICTHPTRNMLLVL